MDWLLPVWVRELEEHEARLAAAVREIDEPVTQSVDEPVGLPA
jgi:hypothetical protein